MQVSVEATNGLERRVTIEIPEQRIEQEVKSRLKNLARKARLDGFRPGKTPLNLIERKFSTQVRQEVLDELMRDSFKDALLQEKLRPASTSQITTLYQDPGKGFGYTATFEIYPEITLAPLGSLQVDMPVAEITGGDVDNMVDILRRQRQIWTPVERPAATGDQVRIDLKLSIDGGEFEQNENMPTRLVMGANTHPKMIEEKLLGASAGMDVMVDHRIPDDYQDSSLAGKSMQYAIRINSVEEPKLPDVNEEFIHGLGVTEGTLEALRHDVQDNLQRELNDAIQVKLKALVVDALLAAHSIEVPKALIESEAEVLMKQAKERAMTAGTNTVNVDATPSTYEPQARRRVTLGLLMGEIIKLGQIKLDPVRVRARVEAIAATYEDSSEVIKWYYANRDRLSQIEAIVLEDQVVEWVLNHAQVSPHITSFSAVMNPEPPIQEIGT